VLVAVQVFEGTGGTDLSHEANRAVAIGSLPTKKELS
jgi:hypothetical protein